MKLTLVIDHVLEKIPQPEEAQELSQVTLKPAKKNSEYRQFFVSYRFAGITGLTDILTAASGCTVAANEFIVDIVYSFNLACSKGHL